MTVGVCEAVGWHTLKWIDWRFGSYDTGNISAVIDRQM
jgi:hypothetical protein